MLLTRQPYTRTAAAFTLGILYDGLFAYILVNANWRWLQFAGGISTVTLLSYYWFALSLRRVRLILEAGSCPSRLVGSSHRIASRKPSEN